MKRTTKTSTQRSGFSVVETVVAITLLAVVTFSAISMIESGNRFSRSTLETTAVEDLSQQMLYRLERELANASAHQPAKAFLALPFPSSETTEMVLDSTLGFPPFGSVVIGPGTATEERVAYRTLTPGQTTLEGLERGFQCTTALSHGQGPEVFWAGHAEWIDDQANPQPGDRIALEEGVEVYFRGDGVGFSYRIPVDPAGGNNVLDRNDLHWGSSIPGIGQTTDGWMCFYYEPKTVFDEAVENHDLNGDADYTDVFDIGQVRRRSWSIDDPTQLEDVAWGPSAVLQEQCNWGGDLDNDGYGDPLFLWNEGALMLHIRLTVIGSSRVLPTTRRIESYTFLRNRPESTAEI